jgi:protein XagA
VIDVRVKAGLLLGLGLLVVPTAARAGAWTLNEGTGQAALIGTLSQASQIFDWKGNVTSAPRYTKFELQGLLEYGVTARLTLMFLPGLQHVDIDMPGNPNRTGLGYTEGGARYQLLSGPNWVFSGQATVRVPGTFDAGNPAAIGYTGFESDIRALFGYSFSVAGMPAFINLEAAQRFRFGGPPDEFRFDATFGLRPAPNWLLLAQVFNVVSEGAGEAPFSTSYNYHKLQLSVVYDLTPRWALQLGGFTTFAGRNALQENGVLLGTWYKF